MVDDGRGPAFRGHQALDQVGVIGRFTPGADERTRPAFDFRNRLSVRDARIEKRAIRIAAAAPAEDQYPK